MRVTRLYALYMTFLQIFYTLNIISVHFYLTNNCFCVQYNHKISHKNLIKGEK